MGKPIREKKMINTKTEGEFSPSVLNLFHIINDLF